MSPANVATTGGSYESVRLSLPLFPFAFAMSFDKSPHKASSRRFEKNQKPETSLKASWRKTESRYEAKAP